MTKIDESRIMRVAALAMLDMDKRRKMVPSIDVFPVEVREAVMAKFIADRIEDLVDEVNDDALLPGVVSSKAVVSR